MKEIVHFVVSSKDEIITACNIVVTNAVKFTTEAKFTTCENCRKALKARKYVRK